MNNDTNFAVINSPACRMIGRIWSSLPQERRSSSQLHDESYPNVGKPWKTADDEELRRLFAAGTESST